MSLQRTVLGNSGIEVTELCFGTLVIGWLQADLEPSEGAKAIRRALELGVNFIDTAKGYKTYEHSRLGIEGFDDVVIASKSPVKGAVEMREDVEACLRELNRETIDRLVTALDTGKAGLLRRAYAKKAFPSVYNDPASVEDHLTRALSLGDLTSEQRNRLNEIAADYRPAYEQLSQKLIELGGLEPRWGMADEDFDWKAEQQRQQDLATVRFDRDELSARASAQLAAILTEEQVRRIGGLPEPPEDTNPWGY